MRLAVTSSHARCARARGLIALLHRAGHQVVLCLNQRMLTPWRLGRYYRELGFSAPWVMAQHLTGRGSAELRKEELLLTRYLVERQIRHATVRQACQEAGAQLVNVTHLGDPAALSALKEHACELVLYAGGGLVSAELLALAGQGVLNAHPGPLPRVRGRNPIEWCLFCGIEPEVTVHFISRRVDQGPILLRRKPELPPGGHLGQIRGLMMIASIEALLEATALVASGDFTVTPQRAEDGVTYYAMHPLLRAIVRRELERGISRVEE